jgi:hypothetical protein
VNDDNPDQSNMDLHCDRTRMVMKKEQDVYEKGAG